jgi:transcriptional regulator with XRE-family HTH domain
MSSKVTEKMSFIPAQCRAARALLDWSQAQLAEASSVATKTIADFERGSRTPYDRTLADLRRALEAAGVEFTNGGQPGVRMKATSDIGDEDLLAMLEKDEFWFIRHGNGIDNKTSLRRALEHAADLADVGNSISSIRALDDRIVIGPDQIRRMFKQLGLSRHQSRAASPADNEKVLGELGAYAARARLSGRSDLVSRADKLRAQLGRSPDLVSYEEAKQLLATPLT